MYWREYFATVEDAERAQRLGDLGRVKLSVAQKQAIQAAKAEAKVTRTTARTTAKTAALTSKLALKELKRTKKAELVGKKYDAKIAAQEAKRAGSAFDASQAIQASEPLALPDTSALALPFSQGGGSGGGGGGALAPFEPPAAAALPADESAPFGIPIPVLLAAAGLVLFLVMRK